MENCIFCKIVERKIDSAVIWEDKDFLAILDVNPNMKGMTLVLAKAHYGSYAFDLPDGVYAKFFDAAKAVAQLLEKALGVHRVALVMEGMGVDHAHLKLYPLPGVKKEFGETWAKERAFFETYEGYLSTQLGPPADIAELKKFAEEIRKHASK